MIGSGVDHRLGSSIFIFAVPVFGKNSARLDGYLTSNVGIHQNYVSSVIDNRYFLDVLLSVCVHILPLTKVYSF